jgi:hypothetical protein
VHEPAEKHLFRPLAPGLSQDVISPVDRTRETNGRRFKFVRVSLTATPLPVIGAVYLVHTVAFSNGDHALVRPCVVVRAPRHKLDYVTFIQRSTTPGGKAGVDHPAGLMPGLELPGRWVLAYERSLRIDSFAASASTCVGLLDDAYLRPLLDRWESR